jgi:hypothetical protein
MSGQKVGVLGVLGVEMRCRFISKNPFTNMLYSGRPKYNPFFKKECIFAEVYFRTQAR